MSTRLKAAIVAVAATTIAAKAAATTAATKATTTTATGTILTRLGLVDLQRSTAQLLAIELFDSRRGFLARGHFDEGEPT